MSPEDARSMCCRLRLDNRELLKRGGGLFGANPLTGSIGVVTINLPRIGYLSSEKSQFYSILKEKVQIAVESLSIKRKVLEKFTANNLYPYSKYYLRDIQNNSGQYWKNHFSTIGIIGMNEASLNFMGEDITTAGGQAFAVEVMDYLRELIAKIQEDTGEIYNLEATPAEGTSHRLSMLDKKKYPDIISANEADVLRGAASYYTNSSQLPVNFSDDIYETLNLQDSLQTKYTGGTVLHIFLGEQVSDMTVIKGLIRKVADNYRLPYFTLSPTFSICPSHGYLDGEQKICSICDQETEVYSRVVGYLRPIKQWNGGKQAEYGDRKTFQVAENGNAENRMTAADSQILDDRRQKAEFGTQAVDDGEYMTSKARFGMPSETMIPSSVSAESDEPVEPNEIKRIWEAERLKAQSANLRVEEAIDRSA
jgi:ribonucleoside-triphosphate reductase